MKLSLFMNVLLVSSLAFVAIGCGKDKKSKGNAQNYYNPYAVGSGVSTVTATGANAVAALNSYLDTVEPNQTVYGMINVSKAKYSCQSKDFLGINFLPYEKCSYSSIPAEVVPVALNQTRRNIKPSIANLMTPPAGYTFFQVLQYGNVIQIQHYMGSEIIEYSVDLSKHAAVNPIQIKDTAQKKIEYVLYPF